MSSSSTSLYTTTIVRSGERLQEAEATPVLNLNVYGQFMSIPLQS